MKGENAKGEVHLYGVSQTVSQTKAAAAVLDEVLLRGAVPEETVIVLPDEKLLMPVLHSVTGAVDKLNVTMGFPLSSTPLFNLVELLIELQLLKRDGEFNHRPVTALLGHPYIVAADAATARAKTKEILHQSWVSIPKSYLATSTDLHRLIFQEITAGGEDTIVKKLITYLRGSSPNSGFAASTHRHRPRILFSFSSSCQQDGRSRGAWFHQKKM